MNDRSESGRTAWTRVRALRSAPILGAFVLLLALEAAALWILTGWWVLELLTATPAPLGGPLALLALSVIASVWVSAITIAAVAGRPWIRGAAVTWQLVQIMIAVGCFQGIYARPDVGWALLLPSIMVIVLVFNRRVIAATTREPHTEA